MTRGLKARSKTRSLGLVGQPGAGGKAEKKQNKSHLLEGQRAAFVYRILEPGFG